MRPCLAVAVLVGCASTESKVVVVDPAHTARVEAALAAARADAALCEALDHALDLPGDDLGALRSTPHTPTPGEAPPLDHGWASGTFYDLRWSLPGMLCLEWRSHFALGTPVIVCDRAARVKDPVEAERIFDELLASVRRCMQRRAPHEDHVARTPDARSWWGWIGPAAYQGLGVHVRMHDDDGHWYNVGVELVSR